jgi:hypothetical protein
MWELRSELGVATEGWTGEMRRARAGETVDDMQIKKTVARMREVCGFAGHEEGRGVDEEYCLEVGGRWWRRESGSVSTGEVEEGIVMRRVSARWEEWEADTGDRNTRR